LGRRQRHSRAADRQIAGPGEPLGLLLGVSSRAEAFAHDFIVIGLTFPYLTTAPDHTTANNLENLPRC